MLQRIGALLTIAFLGFCMLGCPQQDTPYGASGKAALDITDTLHTGADTVDALRIGGTITVEEERTALNAMSALNKLDIDYGSCITKVHAAGDVTSAYMDCANTFLSTVSTSDFLAQVRVSNPKSQQSILNTLSAVQNLLKAVMTQLQNMKPAAGTAAPAAPKPVPVTPNGAALLSLV